MSRRGQTSRRGGARRLAKCHTCKGPIAREPRYDALGREAWVHLNDEDWASNVHHAVPEGEHNG